MSVHIRERKLKDGSIRLYIDIYHNGKREYEFPEHLVLSQDQSAAEKRRIRAQATVIAGKYREQLLANTYTPTAALARTSFLDYYESLIPKRPTAGTQKLWTSTLVHLKRYTNGQNPTFEHITNTWLERWQNYLLGCVGQNSACMHDSILRTALRIAEANDRLPINPTHKVRAIRPLDTERVYLTAEELTAMHHAPCSDDPLKRAFLFACYTGLRISDVRAVTWAHIRDGRIAFRQAKTRGFAYVELSPQAERYMGTASDNPDDRVFALRSTAGIGPALRKWAAAAGVKKYLTFHVARHTFATLLLTYGADLYTVSKLLGHRNIKTTQVYAKVVDERRRAAVAALPMLE